MAGTAHICSDFPPLFSRMYFKLPFDKRILPYIGNTDRKVQESDTTWVVGENSGKAWKLDRLLLLHLLRCADPVIQPSTSAIMIPEAPPEAIQQVARFLYTGR
jgi:hypothetical protein